MRILLAYDGRHGSDAALDDLARAGVPSAAEALVLAAADVPFDSEPPITGPIGRHGHTRGHFALEDALAAAGRGEARLRGAFPEWRVAHDAVIGDAAAAVLERAEGWRPDLVVVGSHAAAPSARPAFGSVARRIVTSARFSVRVGRGRLPAVRHPGVRMVVGVDGSAGSDAAVQSVAGRSWPAGSAAVVVCVVDPVLASIDAPGDGESVPWAWLRDLVGSAADRLRSAGLGVATRLLEGDARRVLVAEAESLAADAIVVGARGQGGAGRTLLGSVATAVVARAPCSVEVVRP